MENKFTLKSKNIKNNEFLSNNQVYKCPGCDGGNLSPELSWENSPMNTKSFALVCHDPDAPRENGWFHWVIVNIPKNVSSFQEGEKNIQGLETMTDFEKTGYDGACPPIGHGIHHYNFTIYSLDVESLNVNENTKPMDVLNLINQHTIDKSTITALYERK